MIRRMRRTLAGAKQKSRRRGSRLMAGSLGVIPVSPWKCCNVCSLSSKECPYLYITKPCAHFVCSSCKEPDSCPTCRTRPVRYEDLKSDSVKPFLESVADSVLHLQKGMGLQDKHYLQSCAREKAISCSVARGGGQPENIPVSTLERETLQFERKIKQMRKWRSVNVCLTADMDRVLKHLIKTYNLQ